MLMPLSTPVPLLTTEDLTVGYFVSRNRPRPVAGPLDLALRPGELVCLLGPNGAGKSTLLRTLAGLQPPLSGRLDLGGAALARMSAAERAHQLSVVLTDRVDAGNLTVRELVSLGRHPHTGWLGTLSTHDEAQVQAELVPEINAGEKVLIVGESGTGKPPTPQPWRCVRWGN